MGLTEKSPKGRIASAPGGSDRLEVRIRSLSRISGDDPTIVIVPPTIAQNPTGISRVDNGISRRLDTRPATGRNRAVAPVFCMNAEIKPTEPASIATMRLSDLPPYFTMEAETVFMTPVRSSPAPMIITAITAITAFEAKAVEQLLARHQAEQSGQNHDRYRSDIDANDLAGEREDGQTEQGQHQQHVAGQCQFAFHRLLVGPRRIFYFCLLQVTQVGVDLKEVCALVA